jgi:hypothetical protein
MSIAHHLPHLPHHQQPDGTPDVVSMPPGYTTATTPTAPPTIGPGPSSHAPTPLPPPTTTIAHMHGPHLPHSLNASLASIRDALLTQSLDPQALSSMVQSFVMSNPSHTPLVPIIHALFDAIAVAETQYSASRAIHTYTSPTTANAANPGGGGPNNTSATPGTSGTGTAATAVVAGTTGTPTTTAAAVGGAIAITAEPLYALLQRYMDACQYFPPTLSHAGVHGPPAGSRALQIQLRKASIWIPHPPVLSSLSSAATSSSSLASPGSSMAEEMERIKADRQRRKDYTLWARLHAAALELGMLNIVEPSVAMGHHHHHHHHHQQHQHHQHHDTTSPTANDAGGGGGGGHNGDIGLGGGGGYLLGRAFSEMMVRDAVWEADEVEWVAGVCVLRAMIRTGVRGDLAQCERYEALWSTYESRWKEIKDEARQTMVAVCPSSFFLSFPLGTGIAFYCTRCQY